jgi:hypothetical protein
MTYYDDEGDKPKKKGPKRVYVIINDEKHYIDPEIVEKYSLDKQEFTFFTGRKLYTEKS